MGSSSLPSFIQISTFCEKLSTPQKKVQFGITKNDTKFSCSLSSHHSYNILQKSVPLAASIAILLWSTPGKVTFYHALMQHAIQVTKTHAKAFLLLSLILYTDKVK
jgi:hypothetical protein